MHHVTLNVILRTDAGGYIQNYACCADKGSEFENVNQKLTKVLIPPVSDHRSWINTITML